MSKLNRTKQKKRVAIPGGYKAAELMQTIEFDKARLEVSKARFEEFLDEEPELKEAVDQFMAEGGGTAKEFRRWMRDRVRGRQGRRKKKSLPRVRIKKRPQLTLIVDNTKPDPHDGPDAA